MAVDAGRHTDAWTPDDVWTPDDSGTSDDVRMPRDAGRLRDAARTPVDALTLMDAGRLRDAGQRTDARGHLDAYDCAVPTSQDTGSKLKLIAHTLELIRAVLPKYWIVVAAHDSFSLMKLSFSTDPAIQRNVFITHSGVVRITVHRKQISSTLQELFLQDWSENIVLTSQSQKLFVDRALAIVLNVKRYEICAGADNETFSDVWTGDSSGRVDENPYDESRYVKTFRSSGCVLLVPVEKWRCEECMKANERLRARFKFHVKEELHPNTRNDYLDPQQVSNKLQKQKNELKRARVKIDYLNRVKELLQTDGVKIDSDLSEQLVETLRDAELTPMQSLFLQQQVKSSVLADGRGMRWHPSMIRFALMLRCASGSSGYSAIRQSGVIKLPGERTLFDYTHAVPIQEGVFYQKLDTIREKVIKYEEEHQKFHNLLVDEIHISQKLVYRKSDGSLVGYMKLTEVEQELKLLEEKINGTESSQPEVASCILAYMVKGVSNSLKELVAAFPVKALKREDLFERSWNVISACEVRNIKILAVVCDGSAVNRSFIAMHTPATVSESHPGLVFDTVNMCSPDRNLYFIADPPHLMKTIRNCFAKSGQGKKCTRLLTKNKQFIVWKTIERLYVSEMKNTLRRCYKLTSQNVYLNSYTCMRVNYAVQVLSNTVGQDLMDKCWPGTEETAEFILKCDKFFDCLNGAHTDMGKRTENPRLAPYTSVDDWRFNELRSFEKYLLDWEIEVKNCNLPVITKEKCLLSRQTLEGIYITVNAFIGAVKFMLSTGAKFINGRVMCQDPLEQYFSKQRAAGGGKNNPTVLSFLNAENKISIHRDLNVRRSSINTEGASKMMEASDEPVPKRRRTK
ncbi:Transposable element P transposase [Frankliniella fusca]|uniref:Transposable element P transposase n=1 Tax=Frankliniella fusca TaxID=407009 RepID=A0AAE1HF25_9NEOP|nr:Transposable element P transposase [Frankliniella fusca]